MRTSTINRKTAETDISLTLNLDGSGVSTIDSGCGFLDHMLTLFARHGGFDLTLTCKGDTYVDDHHTVEDIGICLGKALTEALGDKRGIRRYGDRILPMDETLILSAVDISGRGGCFMDMSIPTEKVGTFDTQLCEEFFIALAQNGGLTLHIRQLAGRNSHHIIEGTFKSVARSLGEAVSIDAKNADKIPSTKGILA
ncbi:MAG: imidazoleglycerol-phosphate dehydratase HisB [Clostridia bacterium]|nr:imidazoleglycerol-phosphate dehydratase HisB [Clostridia bacterium]